MKVLTSTTNNSAGGAAKSCIRLHQALLENGISSELLMLEQPHKEIPHGHSFYEFHVKEHKKKNVSLSKKIYTKVLYELGKDEEALFNKKMAYEAKIISQKKYGSETFHFASSQYRINEHPLYKEAKIVNLHCMINNFLDYTTFFADKAKPIVWTLHDMTPFTGGCVYSEGCDGYLSSCANCPQLKGTDNPNYTADTLKVKQKALERMQNFTIVSPSIWLLNESKKSSLFKNFRHELIPYGLNSNVFKPRDKAYSRDILGLPVDKPVILFVSHNIHNQRKGYQYLSDAFKALKLQDKVSLCAVGAKSTDSTDNGFIELGSFSDERLMSIVYSAADIFVIPSVEDNLPNTVLESLLCGTPVIGFPIGGIPDMIESGINGFLCDNVSVDALAKQITVFLDNPEVFNRKHIRENAVKKYDSSVQSGAYIKLYNELLQNN
ncbi:glycosyltransferase [Cytophagaceae bacterium DM2B3-1]|uniref:Glycosyltransferase n=1 Tax=Xanthocytophaga flava TaxID=3048013 RepID=A0ABT7CE80_9BACT|nr:glycosyltransferase [Xanthocytophaga flavus]MDJ1491952.1 glycosyltransferase [Xanthocytophaga flavus]